jgi:hypothetical protein
MTAELSVVGFDVAVTLWPARYIGGGADVGGTGTLVAQTVMRAERPTPV